MPSRIAFSVVGVLVCVAAAGCKKGSSNSDGGADMAMALDDMPTGADLTPVETDGGQPDLTGVANPDMVVDDHNRLRIPPTAVPMSTDGGVDYYEMHVKEGQVQARPGAMTTITGFEGTWPGPMIKATMGRPVKLKIFNELTADEPITIHNHGHNVASQWDGHPTQHAIAKGDSYVYEYPNVQGGTTNGTDYEGAGTYFFHDHAAHMTGKHVASGMSAPYIMLPKPGSKEANLGLPTGAYDIPLLIQDRTFNADNSLKYVFNIVNGFLGETLVVNGTVKPFMEVARRKYRLRMISHCSARRLQVAVTVNGQPQNSVMSQIASDGGLLPATITPANILLGPAERADIVIDFAKFKIGDVVTLINQDVAAPALPEILQFRVTKNELDNSALPAMLDTSFVRYNNDTIPAPDSGGVQRTRQLSFTTDSGEWKINSRTYMSSVYEFDTSKLGDVEIWELRNADASSTVSHPFHQHLIEFQILDVCPAVALTSDMGQTPCGTAPAPSQSGWKDTVLVAPNTVVRIKMKYYYNGPDRATHFPTTGQTPYVFHCHNLEHEDMAMMLQQSISGP